MKTICVTSLKGGTGKTMLVFQLSGYLSDRGYKVLVIDLDPQGNLTRACLPERPSVGMFEFLTGTAKLEDIVIQPYKDNEKLKNIYILPTTYDLFYFKEGTEDKYSPLQLRDVFNSYKLDFDICLIDTNPSESLAKTSAFCYSDYILGVLDASLDSVEGFDYLQETTISVVKEEVNQKLSTLGILLNEHDRRTTVSREMLKHMKKKYKDLFLDTVIPVNVKTAESRIARVPLVEYDPRCAAGIKFSELTSEIIKRLGKDVA